MQPPHPNPSEVHSYHQQFQPTQLQTPSLYLNQYPQHFNQQQFYSQQQPPQQLPTLTPQQQQQLQQLLYQQQQQQQQQQQLLLLPQQQQAIQTPQPTQFLGFQQNSYGANTSQLQLLQQQHQQPFSSSPYIPLPYLPPPYQQQQNLPQTLYPPPPPQQPQPQSQPLNNQPFPTLHPTVLLQSSASSSMLPLPPPLLKQRIDDFCSYFYLSPASSLALESYMLQKHSRNPEFSWLFPEGSYHYYFQWRKEKEKKGTSKEEMEKEIQHTWQLQNLSEAPNDQTSPATQPDTVTAVVSSSETLSNLPPPPPPPQTVTPDIPILVSELPSVLANLQGSKHSIQSTRKLLMFSAAHTQTFLQLLPTLLNPTSSPAYALHLLYLLHDLLHKTSLTRSSPDLLDDTASQLLSLLPSLLPSIYSRQTDPAVSEKIKKMLNLWGERDIYALDTMAELQYEMEKTKLSLPSPPQSSSLLTTAITPIQIPTPGEPRLPPPTDTLHLPPGYLVTLHKSHSLPPYTPFDPLRLPTQLSENLQKEEPTESVKKAVRDYYEEVEGKISKERYSRNNINPHHHHHQHHESFNTGRDNYRENHYRIRSRSRTPPSHRIKAGRSRSRSHSVTPPRSSFNRTRSSDSRSRSQSRSRSRSPSYRKRSIGSMKSRSRSRSREKGEKEKEKEREKERRRRYNIDS